MYRWNVRCRWRDVWGFVLLAGLLASACGGDPPADEKEAEESPADLCDDRPVLGSAGSYTMERAVLSASELRGGLVFQVPEDLVSTIVTVNSPGGMVLWNRGAIDRLVLSTALDIFGARSATRAMPGFAHVSSYLYPNNEVTRSELGRCLRLSPLVVGGGDVELTVTTVRRPERALGQVLDLQLRVLDGSVSDEEIVEIVASVQSVFSQACTDEHCLDVRFEPEFLRMTSESGTGVVEVDELFSLDSDFAVLARMEGPDSRALNVVLVESLEMSLLDEDLTLLGLAGGIPSSPFDGTVGSSLVINVEAHRTVEGQLWDGFIGSTIAHEVGHMMGLFHTTEQDGRGFDPLEDTAECPAGSFDANDDGRVDVHECQGAGADNLMFWMASLDSLSRLTLGQSDVLRSHPLVYGVHEP